MSRRESMSRLSSLSSTISSLGTLDGHLYPRGEEAVGLPEARFRHVVEPDRIADLERQPRGERGHEGGLAVDAKVVGGLEVRQHFDELGEERLRVQVMAVIHRGAGRGEILAHLGDRALLSE